MSSTLIYKLENYDSVGAPLKNIKADVMIPKDSIIPWSNKHSSMIIQRRADVV